MGKRFWAIFRVSGTHTEDLSAGVKIPATGKKMVVGPQCVSLTLNDDGLVTKFTGGYVVDNKEEGTAGEFGAMFAVLKSIGAPYPRPGTLEHPGKRFLLANWIGSMTKNFPKQKSRVEDLPDEWKKWGRKSGLMSSEA